VATEDFELAAEFVEVETGKGSDALERRPQLAAALATGRQRKCPVIVAKLASLRRRNAVLKAFSDSYPRPLAIVPRVSRLFVSLSLARIMNPH